GDGQCQGMTTTATTSPAFERTSKRRKGFPSETRVKRGLRFVRGGEKELVEKLGRNDPCPCGSGKRFQALLHELGPVSTGRSGTIIGGEGTNELGAFEPDRPYYTPHAKSLGAQF